ncbi:MAG: dTDP-4-dehydrorhamnose reductase [Prevotella sp.]|nr:dTDP-4-dehydrorhamnose reductase [Prevotella sp.]
MNIMITGCNGQLGNELQLLEKKYPQHSWLNTDVEELDITNQLAVEQYVAENKIDGIVNCAAFTAVDKAEDEKEKCTTLNTVAPAYLAAAVNKRNGWMIHISTDYVFNGTNHIPYQETDTPCPESVYGSTKLAGEMGVQKFCKHAVIIRTAWLYSSFGSNFVKTMMRLGRERERIGVVFDQIGTPTYARDLAQAIMTIIDKGLVPGVFHFSNEGVTSWFDFAKAIHRIAGITTCHVSPLHTEEYPTPACRPHYSVLDKTKIKETFGMEIPYWEESLEECIKTMNKKD